MKIVYAPESIDDLAGLRDFIKTKNPEAAQKIAGSILEGIKKLKRITTIAYN